MTTIAIVNGKRTIVHSAKENAKEAISNFIGRLNAKDKREREEMKYHDSYYVRKKNAEEE